MGERRLTSKKSKQDAFVSEYAVEKVLQEQQKYIRGVPIASRCFQQVTSGILNLLTKPT